MGLPIAGHLNRAGHLVTVHDSNTDRMLLATGSGLKAVDSAAAAAREADVLLTVLPGAADCDSVMLGIDRVVESLRPGSGWRDLTTNDPRVADRPYSDSTEVVWCGVPTGFDSLEPRWRR